MTRPQRGARDGGGEEEGEIEVEIQPGAAPEKEE